MDGTGKKVLIVEKDTGIANMIRAILNIVNLQVVHVQLGQDAIIEMGQQDLGLIIADNQLPDMNAHELLQYSRSNARTGQVPFLMLVPEDDTTHLQYEGANAADRYITKPFTARKVLDVVKEFIVYR